MLDNGCTLQEIQDSCNIWYSVPEHLKNVNKDNCFTISWWQCCDKPAYQIKYIYMEISNEKFGMLLKEAASEAGRRRGISVARTLIDEGVVGSTSSLS